MQTILNLMITTKSLHVSKELFVHPKFFLTNIKFFNTFLLHILHADLAFFDLILPLSQAWHIITLIIVTALSASSVDTLITGITSIFSADLLRFGLSDRKALIVSRIMLAAILIPAVIMSSKRFDVIGLFLVADLVCGTAVFPVFLGLITKDIGFIPAPTEFGAFLGIWSGIISVLVNGKVNGFTEATNSITGETIATGPFSYFWLTNSYECAVCGTQTMVTFIVVPLVAAFFTLFFSKLDIMIRGERARQPIFIMAQPEIEAENYILKSLKEVDESEKEEGSEEPPNTNEDVDGTSEEFVDSSRKDDAVEGDADGDKVEISA